MKRRLPRQPHRCFYCDGEHIEGGPIDIQGREAVQDVYCRTCCLTYQDVYVITHTVADGVLHPANRKPRDRLKTASDRQLAGELLRRGHSVMIS